MKKREAKKINFRKLTIAKLNMLNIDMIRGGNEEYTKYKTKKVSCPPDIPTEITEKKGCLPTDENCNIIEYR